MAVVLRCGEVVHLSTVHRLREVWLDVAGKEVASSQTGTAPVEQLQAHVYKRRVRGRHLTIAHTSVVVAAPEDDSGSSSDGEDAAEAALGLT